MSVTTINHIEKNLGIIGVCALALLITACQAQPGAAEPTPTPPVQVIGQEVITLTPSPTPACTPPSAGMTLTVTPLSPATAEVKITGLEPGEIPIFIYFSQGPEPESGGRRNEEWSVQTADAEGGYTARLTNMQMLEGNTVNLWQLQVIHKKGVACAEVILPGS